MKHKKNSKLTKDLLKKPNKMIEMSVLRCVLCGKSFKIGYYEVKLLLETQYISTGEVEKEKNFKSSLTMPTDKKEYVFKLGGDCAHKLIKSFERIHKAPFTIKLFSGKIVDYKNKYSRICK